MPILRRSSTVYDHNPLLDNALPNVVWDKNITETNWKFVCIVRLLRALTDFINRMQTTVNIFVNFLWHRSINVIHVLYIWYHTSLCLFPLWGREMTSRNHWYIIWYVFMILMQVGVLFTHYNDDTWAMTSQLIGNWSVCSACSGKKQQNTNVPHGWTIFEDNTSVTRWFH